MNNGSTLTGVIEGGAALLLMGGAYLIKYKKQVNIIAGYDEKECKNKDGLANWVGGTLMICGIICFLLAMLVIILPHYTDLIMGFFAGTIIISCIIATNGSKKYKY